MSALLRQANFFVGNDPSRCVSCDCDVTKNGPAMKVGPGMYQCADCQQAQNTSPQPSEAHERLYELYLLGKGETPVLVAPERRARFVEKHGYPPNVLIVSLDLLQGLYGQTIEGMAVRGSAFLAARTLKVGYE